MTATWLVILVWGGGMNRVYVPDRAYWKNSGTAWLNGREEELEWQQGLLMNLEDLLSLKNYEPYRLLHSDGEIDGVIKQLNFVLGSRGIKDVVGTFFKI